MRNLIGLTLLFAAPGLAQWPNGYTYKATFVVQPGKVTGTQSNFTAVVGGSAIGLKTVANSGHVQNTCMQTLYGLTIPADLIFTSDSAGTVPLKWQFDTYSASTGAYSAHVLMANIDISANSTLYMWYGKGSATTCQGGLASATWDANTQAALATPNGTTLNTSDYLGNTVTIDTGGVTAASGLNSGAAVFSHTTTSDLQIAGMGRRGKPLTACIWEKTTAGSNAVDYQMGGDTDPSGSYDSIELRMMQATGRFHTTVYSGGWYAAETTVAINNGAWHQACDVITSTGGANNAGQIKLYVDGAASGSAVDLPVGALSSAGSSYFSLGRSGAYISSNQSWNGSLAEFTLDRTARDANWISARYNNVGNPSTFWSATYDLTGSGGGGTFSITSTVIPNGHAGNIALTLAGIGTSWVNASTVMTASGVANVSCGAVTVISSTVATIVCTTGAGTGTLTLTESVSGTASQTMAVSVPSLSLNLTRGNINSVQTLTLTGTNTVWSQETAAGLFTLSGGTGAGMATPAITTNTAGTVALTVGTSVGTLTITDTSTGKTATFTVGGVSGPSVCAVVSAQ